MIKKLNGFAQLVDIRPFSNSEKVYIKDTRIPVDFLLSTVKETGDVNSFLNLYPRLKERKKELLAILSYVLEQGSKNTLYDKTE